MENGRGEKGNESKVKGKMAKVKRQSEKQKDERLEFWCDHTECLPEC